MNNYEGSLPRNLTFFLPQENHLLVEQRENQLLVEQLVRTSFCPQPRSFSNFCNILINDAISLTCKNTMSASLPNFDIDACKGGVIIPDGRIFISLEHMELELLFDEICFCNEASKNGFKWEVQFHCDTVFDVQERLSVCEKQTTYAGALATKMLQRYSQILQAYSNRGCYSIIPAHSCKFDDLCFNEFLAVNRNVVVLTDESRDVQAVHKDCIYLQYEHFYEIFVRRRRIRHDIVLSVSPEAKNSVLITRGCANCLERFVGRKQLLRHLRLFHQVETKECNSEDYSFLSIHEFQMVLNDIVFKARKIFVKGTTGYIVLQPPEHLRREAGDLVVIGTAPEGIISQRLRWQRSNFRTANRGSSKTANTSFLNLRG